MASSAHDEQIINRLNVLESKFEALVIQDRSGSKVFGVGRIPFGGASGTLTDENVFSWDTTNKRLLINATTAGNGTARIVVRGTNASAAGPHTEFLTNADDYPVLQLFNFSHDNIQFNWDCYFDNTVALLSADAGSNFQLIKTSDLLRFRWATGAAVGTAPTWGEFMHVDLTTGEVRIGSATAPAFPLDVTGDINTTTDYNVASTKVVGARKTGWSAMTGTAARTAAATHTAQTISNPPTQTQVQNIDNSLVIVAQRLKALIDDLHATAGHGLIGA